MDYEIVQIADDALAHWGIKGMRWGVRRYQNKDGSLTDRGKKRLRAEQAKVREQEKIVKNRKETQAKFDRLEARKKAVEEEKKALDNKEAAASGKKSGKKVVTDEKPVKKSVKDMTDDELLAAINRSRLEATYNQLHPQPEKNPLMNKLKNEVLIPAAVNSGKKFLEDSLKKMGENLLKDKVDPNSIEALKKTFDKLDLQQKIDKINNPDKYLSEEDKAKRQKREYDAEDRESQRRGYKDVQEEARTKREAAEKDAKKADEEAGRANKNSEEPKKSSIYEEFTKQKKTESAGEEFFKQKSDDVIDAYGYTVHDDRLTSGRSYVSNYLALPAPGLPAPKDDD